MPDEPVRQRERKTGGLFDDTWELELLISGAVLFGLVQLPARLDGWWNAVKVHAAGDLRFAYFLVYYYLSLILLTLIATFGLHIAARTYWVGVVGLRSVFPDGPDFGQLDPRRVAHQVTRRLVPSLARAARAADAFCSTLFSVATLLVGILLLSVAFGALFGALAALVRRWLWPQANLLWLAVGSLWVTLLPLMAASVADALLARRAHRPARADRWIRRTVTCYGYAFLTPVLGSITATLFTRVRRRLLWPASATVVIVVGGVFLGRTLAHRDLVPLPSSYAFTPAEDSGRLLDPRHYGDQRRPGRIDPQAPWIQSQLLRDPFIRLVIPYYPQADNALLDELCPELGRRGATIDGGRSGGTRDSVAAAAPSESVTSAPAAPHRAAGSGRSAARDESAEAEPARWLACLARRYEVTLDGQPLGQLRYDFFRDAVTAAWATATFIPARDLAPGRHELRLRRRSSTRGRGRRQTRQYVIAFWR